MSLGDVPPSRAESAYRGFLFADLRGYSEFAERHGDDAAAELLDRYRDVVRAEIARFSGAEVRTEGDSFYVTFGTARAGVACGLAIAASARAAAAPIPVGIGIHAGEAVERGAGYVGSAVNIAARVCAQARAGEVLVTATVRELTKTGIQVAYRPRGTHRLKGIAEPMILFSAHAAQGVTSPAARPSRIQAQLRRIAPFAILAGIVIAAIPVAVVLVSAMVRGTDPTVGAGASSSPVTPSASGSMSSAASSAPNFNAGPFPNELEAALLARLDPAIARHCARASVEHTPVLFQLPSRVITNPIAVDVGLLCSLGGSDPDEVTYWHSPGGRTDEEISEVFYQTAGRRSISSGNCEVDPPAYERWEFGIQHGLLLCYGGTRAANLMWTYADEGILATATREDSDMQALLGWWQDHARTLGPGG